MTGHKKKINHVYLYLRPRDDNFGFVFQVIVADADPQCNLTHALEPTARTDPSWRDDVDRGNIYSAVRDLHNGIRNASKSQMDPVACRVIERCTEGDSGDHALYLLPGMFRGSVFGFLYGE